MQISFFKYQGTGNDFILIDNRQLPLSKNDTNLIKHFCDRKFGIGADGLILLQNPSIENVNFDMLYFNADGRESSMCGNGGRCIVAFANFLGIVGEKCTFLAIDGEHEALLDAEKVSLKMKNIKKPEKAGEDFFLDTGSPHHIIFSDNISGIDVKKEGAAVRYSDKYAISSGTNVNFAEISGENKIRVRTYERGVEDETLSCGTGVTAVALAAFSSGKVTGNTVSLETPGGNLEVSFDSENEGFGNIWLSGPAEQVFKGEIEC